MSFTRRSPQSRRLREEGYADKDLREWVTRIGSQNWDEAYVFVKHEDSATGPKLAARLVELVDA